MEVKLSALLGSYARPNDGQPGPKGSYTFNN